jgi:hypothetical protein
MKRPYKRWSKEEVVKVIRELSGRGEPLNPGHVARARPALAYAGRKYLGSWENAIRAAGLDFDKIRRKNFWSRQVVVERIRELHVAGEPLHVSYCELHHGGLVGAASGYFGSWRRAIEAAGLEYRRIKRQHEWSKSIVVAEVRLMHRSGVKIETTGPVRAQYRILHAAAIRYFRSWAAAVKAAGLGKYLRH